MCWGMCWFRLTFCPTDRHPVKCILGICCCYWSLTEKVSGWFAESLGFHKKCPATSDAWDVNLVSHQSFVCKLPTFSWGHDERTRKCLRIKLLFTCGSLVLLRSFFYTIWLSNCSKTVSLPQTKVIVIPCVQLEWCMNLNLPLTMKLRPLYASLGDWAVA